MPAPHRDPAHPNNSPTYHTGKPCIMGCGRPAGTAWGLHWCQPCNAERMDRISRNLEALVAATDPDR